MPTLNNKLYRCRVRNAYGQNFSNPAALSITPITFYIPWLLDAQILYSEFPDSATAHAQINNFSDNCLAWLDVPDPMAPPSVHSIAANFSAGQLTIDYNTFFPSLVSNCLVWCGIRTILPNTTLHFHFANNAIDPVSNYVICGINGGPRINTASVAGPTGDLFFLIPTPGDYMLIPSLSDNSGTFVNVSIGGSITISADAAFTPLTLIARYPGGQISCS